ncbi:MAG: SRPBCC family protein [Bacteroidota bacterium]
MKILKGILYVVIGLVLVATLYGLLGPKEIRMERSTTIEASAENIFPHLVSMKNQWNWSPWAELDPNMKRTYSGKEGEVGSISHWEGNDDIGIGEQELVAVEDMKRVETQLRFLAPFESQADAFLTVEPDEGGKSKVTWGFATETPFPENVMMALIGMESQLASDYDKGLGKLKALVETQVKDWTFDGMLVEQVDMPARTYVAARKVINEADITSFYGESLPKVFMGAQEKNIEMGGPPSGLIFSRDAEAQTVDIAAGMIVDEAFDLGPDFQTIELPAGKALVVHFYGSRAPGSSSSRRAQ